MKTVHEVAELFGVSVRTIQYYDRMGLLPATQRTQAGYRLYDEAALQRLSQILLFRELEFPLAEIREILTSKDFDQEKALRQQISLLTLRKEHLEGLIEMAQTWLKTGGKEMEYEKLNKEKLEEYAQRAKEEWGHTPEYQDYARRSKDWTGKDMEEVQKSFMVLFAELGEMKDLSPEDDKVQEQVAKIHRYICEHFYDCSLEVFSSLGQAYGAGGEFTENIDRAGGAGTGAFAARAIEIYAGRR